MRISDTFNGPARSFASAVVASIIPRIDANILPSRTLSCVSVQSSQKINALCLIYCLYHDGASPQRAWNLIAIRVGYIISFAGA